MLQSVIGNQDMFIWLSKFAEETWNRIEFWRNNERSHLFETTITQNMVFGFYQLKYHDDWPIEIYESTNERTNGSDLEIVFRTSLGYLTLFCQCKIVGQNLKYNTIYHKSGSKHQVEVLLEYAKAHNGIPIYMFYNYCADLACTSLIENTWELPIQQFGCSIADAYFIYQLFLREPINSGKQIVPRFEDVHCNNLAYPFIGLELFFLPIFVKEHIERCASYFTDGSYKNFVSEHTEFFSQTIDAYGWNSLTKKGGAIGKIDLERITRVSSYDEDTLEFLPKYRIVLFDKSTERAGLYRWH